MSECEPTAGTPGVHGPGSVGGLVQVKIGGLSGLCVRWSPIKSVSCQVYLPPLEMGLKREFVKF